MEETKSWIENVISAEKAIIRFAQIQGISDRAEAERLFYATLERTAPQGQERDGRGQAMKSLDRNGG